MFIYVYTYISTYLYVYVYNNKINPSSLQRSPITPPNSLTYSNTSQILVSGRGAEGCQYIS